MWDLITRSQDTMVEDSFKTREYDQSSAIACGRLEEVLKENSGFQENVEGDAPDIFAYVKDDCKWKVTKISMALNFEGDRETSEKSFSFKLKYDEDDAEKVVARLHNFEQLLKDSIADATR